MERAVRSRGQTGHRATTLDPPLALDETSLYFLRTRNSSFLRVREEQMGEGWCRT